MKRMIHIPHNKMSGKTPEKVNFGLIDGFLIFVGIIILALLLSGCHLLPEEEKPTIDYDNQIVSSILNISAMNKDTIIYLYDDTPVPEIIPDENGIYSIADEMPEFPGGDEMLKKYINDAIKETDIPNPTSKRIVCSFIIHENGTISNVKVLRGVNSIWDNQAIDILTNMPDWNPGKIKGEKVKVKYTVPIPFQ